MSKIYEDLTVVTVLYDSSELINDLLKKGSPFKQQKLPMNNSSMYAYKKYMK